MPSKGLSLERCPQGGVHAEGLWKLLRPGLYGKIKKSIGDRGERRYKLNALGHINIRGDKSVLKSLVCADEESTAHESCRCVKQAGLQQKAMEKL